jgi:hypothetical protein
MPASRLRLEHQMAALHLHHGQATGDVDQLRRHPAVVPIHGVLLFQKFRLKAK